VTGEPPSLGARDPSFRLLRAAPDTVADVTLDLGDGGAWRAAKGKRIWGGTVGGRVLLGVEPREGARAASAAALALLETLAAGEALRLLLGLPPHAHEFA
jgi:hypothetical protein